MAELHLLETVGPEVVRIHLIGSVSGRTADELRRTLAPHHHASVQVWMRHCTGIDLDGLFALASAHIESGESGGSLLLTDVPPLVACYMRAHGMSHLAST